MSLHVIDGHAAFYRCYYSSLKTESGAAPAPDHALTAFTAWLKDYADKYQPTHLVVALDVSRETFRHEIFPGYKANRKPVPPELSSQLAQFPAYLDQLGVAHLGAQGFEADDIIGTLCKMIASDTYQVFIASNDKDFCQLVNSRVSIINAKNETIGTDEVRAKFGVLPEQVIEVLALMGDAADGIPGVANIGEKTAIALIQGWLNLESLYERLHEVESGIKSGARIAGLLRVGKEEAFLSRTLATINCDVPLDVNLADFEWRAQP